MGSFIVFFTIALYFNETSPVKSVHFARKAPLFSRDDSSRCILYVCISIIVYVDFVCPESIIL
jgi:hypothetical protein